MKNSINKTSDGTIFYSFEDWRGILKTKSDDSDKILVRDVILSLLLTNSEKPIYGRIMIMKQIFLVFKEIIEPRGFDFQDPKFIPYNYGPYSFLVMQIIDDLRFSGFIQIEGRKGSRKESFKLSSKVGKKIDITFEIVPIRIMNEMKKCRIGWDQLGTDGILRYVYEYYPDMKVKSKIKNRYEDISWGLGKA